MTSSSAYWDKVGSDWSLIGPPLRPCREDIDCMEHMVGTRVSRSCIAAPQAVILGVTQEIVRMRWPENTHVLAFDQEPAMIQSVWPHHSFSNAAAICSNWLSLPLVDGCSDVVIGDGAFTMLAFPDVYLQQAHELKRILASDGIVVMRMFTVPEHRESVDDVFDNLWAGTIENFNIFKWRLAMALTNPVDYSVCVNDVWETWNAHIGSSVKKLADTLGWSPDVIKMIERYRGCVATRYSFPPLDRICEVLAHLFRQEEVIIPSYQDGERYPTICFRRI
jgi:hypothetical protein